MRSGVAVLAASMLLCVACPLRTDTLPKPPPQMAPVAELPLNVTFYGTVPNEEFLFVCGWHEGKFGCFERTTFEKLLQDQ
jgi:hypothetical protein